MEGHLFLILVLSATLCVVFGTPLQQNAFQPNYDNIPQCLQPMQNGLCLAYIPSYYYNPGKKTCESFIYGGCGGNKNRFLTFAQCMATCEGVEPENKEFKLILPSETIDPCSLPRETGPCRAGVPRFYFSGDSCVEFLYGGCEGNENNFNSLEECQERCSNKSSEENENVQPDSENKSEEVVEDQAQPESEEAATNE